MTLARLSGAGPVAELADASALRVDFRKEVRVRSPPGPPFPNGPDIGLSSSRVILFPIPSLPQLTGRAAQRVSRSLPGAVPAAAGNHRTGAVNEADQETNSSGQDHPGGATQAGGRGPGWGVWAGVEADPAEAGLAPVLFVGGRGGGPSIGFHRLSADAPTLHADIVVVPE
jgi:hypothetical protein